MPIPRTLLKTCNQERWTHLKASVDDQIYIIALKNSDIFSNYLKEKEIINGKCLGSGVTVGERNLLWIQNLTHLLR